MKKNHSSLNKTSHRNIYFFNKKNNYAKEFSGGAVSFNK
ncbi:MAG: hypothetical protein RLZZ312_776 [Bacteroidota bacterium]|jgi:hypothetical protein